MNRLLLTAIALTAALPAPAQRGNRGGGDVFGYLAEKYDRDGDGKITVAEYNHQFQRDEARFRGYDRNGDGVITREDLSGGGRRRGGARGRNPGGRGRGPAGGTTSIVGPAIAQALADNADTDSDSRVTREEWRKTLASLDANGDKIGDPAELNGIMCAALGRNTLSARAIERRARHLDTNRDGAVQLAELDAMFAKMDRDGNGELSAAEIGSVRPVARGEPKVGEPAPDFSLPLVADRKTQVRLSSFKGERPVALIFGSYT